MKEVGIEEFAAWCVQEEWPKVSARHVDEDEATRAALLKDIARLTGTGMGWPGLAEMSWGGMVGATVRARMPEGEPHPDAVLFSQACAAMAAEASSPAYDVADCLTDQADVLATGPAERLAMDWRLASPHLGVNLIDPRSLVVTYAAQARRRRDAVGWEVARPDWHPDPIERGYVRGDSGRGQPAWFVMVQRRVRISGRGEPAAYEMRACEEDGRDARLRRPRPGAYRKVVFDPDPGFVARARHTYAVWWCALEYLAAWLEASGALSEHRVFGPQGIEKPWQSAWKRVA